MNKVSGQGTVQYAIVGLVIVSIIASGLALYLVSNIPNNVATKKDLKDLPSSKELKRTENRLKKLEILSALPTVEEFKHSELWDSEWLKLTDEVTPKIWYNENVNFLKNCNFVSMGSKLYKKKSENRHENIFFRENKTIGKSVTPSSLVITILSFSSSMGAEKAFENVKKMRIEKSAERESEIQHEENVTIRVENYSPDLADESFGIYSCQTRKGILKGTRAKDWTLFRENHALVVAYMFGSEIEEKDVLPYARLTERKLTWIS